MLRRILALAAAVLLAGCTAPVAPHPTSAILPQPTIGLTYIPNVQFSPFYLAETDGSFTAAGAQPTLRHHGASEGLFTALAAGQEQFVLAGGDELMQARSEGLDLVAVAAYFHRYPVVVIVPADSPITTLAELKGHSVGLPGKFGQNWFGLQVALKNAGLTEADVEIKEIGYTQQTALSGKKVDAIVGFSNNDAVGFELAGFATRSLPISGTPDGNDAVPLVPACLITTADYAKAHPEAVTAVITGMLAGVQGAVDEPDRALAVSARYVPGLDASRDAATATLRATAELWTTADGEVDGHLDPEQWTAMADFMAAQGLTATRQDPAAAMSNAYLR